jgi:hypothetical protein
MLSIFIYLYALYIYISLCLEGIAAEANGGAVVLKQCCCCCCCCCAEAGIVYGGRPDRVNVDNLVRPPRVDVEARGRGSGLIERIS